MPGDDTDDPHSLGIDMVENKYCIVSVAVDETETDEHRSQKFIPVVGCLLQVVQ